MTKLRDEGGVIAEMSTVASQWFLGANRRIPADAIEKDYWVTETLRVLAEDRVDSILTKNPDNPDVVRIGAIFKGGTSLSKGHNIIDRFSEDVDVFITAESVGANRRDRIMKETGPFVAESLGLTWKADDNARRGTKRTFRLEYPNATPKSIVLKQGVKLELVHMGHAEPTDVIQLRSLLAEWAEASGVVSLEEYEELARFPMKVLNPSRTLVDKLCILHNAGIRIAQGNGYVLGHHARHYYDVAKLLADADVCASLVNEPGMVARYAADAAKNSADVRRPQVPRPSGGFSKSPAFADATVVAHASTEYAREMGSLAYGQTPTIQDIVDLVKTHASLL